MDKQKKNQNPSNGEVAEQKNEIPKVKKLENKIPIRQVEEPVRPAEATRSAEATRPVVTKPQVARPPIFQFTPHGFADVNGFIIKADDAAKAEILDYRAAYEKLVYKIRSAIVKV